MTFNQTFWFSAPFTLCTVRFRVSQESKQGSDHVWPGGDTHRGRRALTLNLERPPEAPAPLAKGCGERLSSFPDQRTSCVPCCLHGGSRAPSAQEGLRLCLQVMRFQKSRRKSARVQNKGAWSSCRPKRLQTVRGPRRAQNGGSLSRHPLHT